MFVFCFFCFFLWANLIRSMNPKPTTTCTCMCVHRSISSKWHKIYQATCTYCSPLWKIPLRLVPSLSQEASYMYTCTLCMFCIPACSRKAKGTIQVPSLRQHAHHISHHSWEEQLCQCSGAVSRKCADLKQVYYGGAVWSRWGKLLPTRRGSAVRFSSTLYQQVSYCKNTT